MDCIWARNPSMRQLSINKASRNNVITVADVWWLNRIVFLKYRGGDGAKLCIVTTPQSVTAQRNIPSAILRLALV
jgi:hypothetical protein